MAPLAYLGNRLSEGPELGPPAEAAEEEGGEADAQGLEAEGGQVEAQGHEDGVDSFGFLTRVTGKAAMGAA